MNQIRTSESGYTLMEILAVLALIAAIMTLVGPNVINSMNSGQIKAAKSQIKSLDNVLKQYYMDNYTYPTTEQGLKALIEKPTIPPIPENWNGPYLSEKTIPKDPWGEEIKYISPGVHNPDKYDIFSLGRDKKEGGEGIEADIGNW